MTKLFTLIGVFMFYTLTFSQESNVMMQGFWKNLHQDSLVKKQGGLYNFLKNQTKEFKQAGIDLIWTPPPSKGEGMGYFPTELYNLNNAHGTESELRSLLKELKKHNIHAMADIIANHRNGTTAWSDFTNPNWDCTAIVENDEVKNIPNQIQPCSNEQDEGEGFEGCRDLNHKNKQVQQGFKEYLNRLKKLGFDSWRWDFTKGFPAKYVAEYNQFSKPYFSVGEYWDANIGLLTRWVKASEKTLSEETTKASATFDFSLYYILARAVMHGNWYELNHNDKMPGLAGTQGYEALAVTFTENHDAHEITGNDAILQANAYILTHPGIPMLYFKHWYNHTEKINELIAVRKNNKLNAKSTVHIVESTTFYAAYIDQKVAVKIGPGNWTPSGTDWILNTSGKDYSVWSKLPIK